MLSISAAGPTRSVRLFSDSEIIKESAAPAQSLAGPPGPRARQLSASVPRAASLAYPDGANGPAMAAAAFGTLELGHVTKRRPRSTSKLQSV